MGIIGVAKQLVAKPIILHPTNTHEAVNKPRTHRMRIAKFSRRRKCKRGRRKPQHKNFKSAWGPARVQQ